jgi:hypothetical protein
MALFSSNVIDEYKNLPARDVPGYRDLQEDQRLALAQMRAALRILNSMGAIKASWLERTDMASERFETSAELDERLRDLITPYVGETGATEDLVQTLERIIEERGNVRRNRERR